MNARRIQQLAAVLLVGLTLAAWMQAPQATEDPKARLAKAEAMFAERCKKSGEFIHRTAENVEGIVLLRVRMRHNHGDQHQMSDPYGHDSTSDEYFKSFLVGRDKNGWQTTTRPVATKGYRYVEALDEKDRKRYRYTGGMKVVRQMDVTAKGVQMALERNPNFDLNIYDFVLNKVPAPGPAPRYGVTYDDISTHEERDYWIAGSSLRVIDLQTNEVMAERIGYMMDRGQGNTGGGRSPWLVAADHACPEFPQGGGGHKYQVEQTRRFVEKSLKPIQD